MRVAQYGAAEAGGAVVGKDPGSLQRTVGARVEGHAARGMGFSLCSRTRAGGERDSPVDSPLGVEPHTGQKIRT